MPKRGRPRGVNINPVAIDDRLAEVAISKSALCAAAGIKSGHLADMLYRGKGTSENTVQRMALALRCSPATLAPELLRIGRLRFVAVREEADLEAVG